MKRGTWTEAHNDFLVKHYRDKGIKWCAENIGIPVSFETIRTYANRLNLKTGRIKEWSLEEESFLIENYAKLGCVKCSAILDRTIPSVQARAIKMNLSYEEGKWTDEEEYWIQNNYNKYSRDLCAKNLGKTINQIRSKAYRKKLKGTYSEKNQITESFLRDWSDPLNVYLFGLFQADGHLQKVGGNKLCYSAQLKDFVTLEPIFRSLGITSFEDRNGHSCRGFSFCRKALAEHLRSANFQLKSKVFPSKFLEQIPKALIHYFWLGFLDGDGTIGTSTRPKNGTTCFLSFCGDKDLDWSDLVQYLESLGVDHIKIYKSKTITKEGKVHQSSRLTVSKLKNQKLVIEELYKNTDRSIVPFFERKWKKAQDILEYIKYRDNKIINRNNNLDSSLCPFHQSETPTEHSSNKDPARQSTHPTLLQTDTNDK